VPWRIRTQHLFSTDGAALHFYGRGEYEKAETWIEKRMEWDAQLVALDRAMEAVCKEHGFDADSVRKLAGTSSFPLHDNTEPDPEIQAVITEAMSESLKFLEG
jgi:hypothetical protein